MEASGFAVLPFFFVEVRSLELETTILTGEPKALSGGNPEGKLNLQGPVHLVGIGGIGMSALARLLLANGFVVSGSDKELSPVTAELESLGAKIFLGHNASNVGQAKTLVVSTAINKTNPEVALALESGLEIWHRSDILNFLSQEKKLVAITGTHGKTTTTGMVAQVLLDGQIDPTVVVGGIFNHIKSNARAGKGTFFVAESDESDGTHKKSQPYFAVITNIEPDHLENYPGGLEQILQDMITFANKASKAVIVCLDDPGCQRIMAKIDAPLITYGKKNSFKKPQYSYESLPGFAMNVFKGDQKLGLIELGVPGEHNKANAMVAIIVALEAGLEFEQITQSLKNFNGVCRRFQIQGQVKDILVVDDYAHHPTEVVATLEAARQYQTSINAASKKESIKRIVALFQPHQPGRLRDFYQEFCQCFKEADLVFIADIYIARGNAIPGIDSQSYASKIEHKNVSYLPGNIDQLPAQILPHLKTGDLVLTIGAGNITNVGPELLKLLEH
jgi:UDP-N-acetylmuramate--alanine ligase